MVQSQLLNELQFFKIFLSIDGRPDWSAADGLDFCRPQRNPMFPTENTFFYVYTEILILYLPWLLKPTFFFATSIEGELPNVILQYISFLWLTLVITKEI